MKIENDKERNERIERLIQFLSGSGNTLKNKGVDAYLEDDQCHNKHQTEEEYLEEQAHWLCAVNKKKKK